MTIVFDDDDVHCTHCTIPHVMVHFTAFNKFTKPLNCIQNQMTNILHFSNLNTIKNTVLRTLTTQYYSVEDYLFRSD